MYQKVARILDKITIGLQLKKKKKYSEAFVYNLISLPGISPVCSKLNPKYKIIVFMRVHAENTAQKTFPNH
jgi:predicted transcriptional regulator of viral defense system